jgi:hypothetical protein
LVEDSFRNEEEEEETSILTDKMYAIIMGDELTTLAEAKRSPDWPKWQKSMKEELDAMNEMGTWELVPKPPGAVPISNRWTFIRKQNKEGNVILSAISGEGIRAMIRI